ncbi:4596_t:CDS:2 [Ambispora leptoticha]|uniref:4596_t:CDS:1 n=1 Tax=Ambispora leptoticha TaxID=144679 RepID=A0A9N9G408_9GLOM|nr:4596_t:CDS:2 [Ambispora leptoticha]
MEFPDLGGHCHKTSCKQLDYLPFKCSYCKNAFCHEHSKPQDHDCPSAPQGDGARVPTCPICNAPVPVNKGEDPNIRMERHIANDCRPAPKTTSTKPFNSCSVQNCKQRVAVKLLCSGCGKNYCIKHRLEVDHMCEKVKSQNRATSISRLTGNSSGKNSGDSTTTTSNHMKPKLTVKNWMNKLFNRK